MHLLTDQATPGVVIVDLAGLGSPVEPKLGRVVLLDGLRTSVRIGFFL